MTSLIEHSIPYYFKRILESGYEFKDFKPRVLPNTNLPRSEDAYWVYRAYVSDWKAYRRVSPIFRPWDDEGWYIPAIYRTFHSPVVSTEESLPHGYTYWVYYTAGAAWVAAFLFLENGERVWRLNNGFEVTGEVIEWVVPAPRQVCEDYPFREQMALEKVSPMMDVIHG